MPLPVPGQDSWADQLNDFLVDVPQRNRMAALGDSTALGSTSADNTLKASNDPLLWAHLYSQARIGYARNAGISGNTTAQMLARIGTDIDPYDPDWCLVLGGTNDAGTGVPLATYAANIAAIVDNLKGRGIRPVLITPFPNPATPVEVPTRRQLLDSYLAWLRYWCPRNGVPLIDGFTLLVDPATGGYLATYNTDGIHPSDGGAQIVGKAISDLVTPQLYPQVPDLAAYTGTDSQNLVPNALYLADANADGVPDSWTKSGSAVAAIESGAADGILGNWLHLSDPVNEFSQINSSNFPASGWSVGDRLKISCRLKTNSTGQQSGGQTKLVIGFTGGTPSLQLLLRGIATPALTYEDEITIPPSTTAVNISIQTQGGAGAFVRDIRVGQLQVRNLTKLGIA
jgi:lysophospholipase L1-like esterase